MIDVQSEKLTIRQIQKETGLSYITIQRCIAKRKIDAELVNEVWFIPRSELSKLPKPRKARGAPANVASTPTSNSNALMNIPDEVKREVAYKALGASKSYENKELDIVGLGAVILGVSCTAIGGSFVVSSGNSVANLKS